MRIVQAGELIGNPEVFSTEDIRPKRNSKLPSIDHSREAPMATPILNDVTISRIPVAMPT
jgi:hypothetical protein